MENSQHGEGSRPCRWRVPVFPEMNVYHKPSLEESPTLWMLSKAKHIRVLEARGTSDVYIPSVKPRPGGEGRMVLRTQVGVLSGKDQASAAAPLSGGGRIALCLQGQWVWAEAPLLWKSHLKKKSVLKKVTDQQLFYYKRFLSNHDISYLPWLLRAPILQINDTMQV